jgi:aspartate-semialdehyde dehydrogenase
MIDAKAATVGIVNPLSLVGTELRFILRERAFPLAKVVLMDSTGHAGALASLGDEAATVVPVSGDVLDDCDVVFFCGAAEGNRKWIQRDERHKFVAIDLSHPVPAAEGKLAVAGVNLDRISAEDRLLVSPHPAAIPIAIILRQLELLAPVEMCTCTVVEPASVFEELGVEELGVEEPGREPVSVPNIQHVLHEVLDRHLAFNLYPAPQRNEELIKAQVRALTDASTQLALLVTQGTVLHSHTFTLFVRTKNDLDVERVTAALRASMAITLAERDKPVGTIDAVGKDEVLIAEVRADESIPGGFWVWAACDNLRRSSALNAVLVAEKMLFGSGTTTTTH